MLQEFLHGAEWVVIYFIIAAGSVLGCRFLFKIPDEIFRKILHSVLLMSLLVFVYGFATWQASVLGCIIFAIVVYPILMFFERVKGYSQLTTERKKGELKSSLLLVFGMFALVIAICWGWMGDRMLVLASIYAWGFGDAAAAIIGKQFGKHKITWKYTDGKKSMEGSLAMFVTSLISVSIILYCRGGMQSIGYVLVPIIVAATSTLAELYSKNGMDTVICPLSAMTVLLPLVYIFGGFV